MRSRYEGGRRRGAAAACGSGRFRTLQDAALDVIGEAVRRVPAKAYVENYVKALARMGRGPDGKKIKGVVDRGRGVKKAAEKTVAKKKVKR